MRDQRYKKTIAGLFAGLPFALEDKNTWIENGRFKIRLEIYNDFTYADLDRVGRLLGTRDISITKCESGYYGEHDDAQVEIGLPESRASEFLLGVDETTQQKKDESDAYDRQRLNHLRLEVAKHEGGR